MNVYRWLVMMIIVTIIVGKPTPDQLLTDLEHRADALEALLKKRGILCTGGGGGGSTTNNNIKCTKNQNIVDAKAQKQATLLHDWSVREQSITKALIKLRPQLKHATKRKNVNIAKKNTKVLEGIHKRIVKLKSEISRTTEAHLGSRATRKLDGEAEKDRRTTKHELRKMKHIIKVAKANGGGSACRKRGLCPKQSHTSVVDGLKRELEHIRGKLNKARHRMTKAWNAAHYKAKKGKSDPKKTEKYAATDQLRMTDAKRELALLKSALKYKEKIGSINSKQAKHLFARVNAMSKLINSETARAHKLRTKARSELDHYAIMGVDWGKSDKRENKMVRKELHQVTRAVMKAKQQTKHMQSNLNQKTPAISTRSGVKALNDVAKALNLAAKAQSTAVQAKQNRKHGGRERVGTKKQRRSRKDIAKTLVIAKKILTTQKQMYTNDKRLKTLKDGNSKKTMSKKTRHMQATVERAARLDRQAMKVFARHHSLQAEAKAAETAQIAARTLSKLGHAEKKLEKLTELKKVKQGDLTRRRQLANLAKQVVNIAVHANGVALEASRGEVKRRKKVTGKSYRTREMQKEVLKAESRREKSAKQERKVNKKEHDGRTESAEKNAVKSLHDLAVAMHDAAEAKLTGVNALRKGRGLAIYDAKRDAQRELRHIIKETKKALALKQKVDRRALHFKGIKTGPPDKRVVKIVKTVRREWRQAEAKVAEATRALSANGVGKNKLVQKVAAEAAKKIADALNDVASGEKLIEHDKKHCCNTVGNLAKERELQAVAGGMMRTLELASNAMDEGSHREWKRPSFGVPHNAKMELKLKTAKRKMEKGIRQEKLIRKRAKLGEPHKAVKASVKALKDVARALDKSAKTEQQGVLSKLDHHNTKRRKITRRKAMNEVFRAINSAKNIVSRMSVVEKHDPRSSTARPGKTHHSLKKFDRRMDGEIALARSNVKKATQQLAVNDRVRAEEFATMSEKKAAKALRYVVKASRIDEYKRHHKHETKGDKRKMKLVVKGAERALNVAKLAAQTAVASLKHKRTRTKADHMRAAIKHEKTTIDKIFKKTLKCKGSECRLHHKYKLKIQKQQIHKLLKKIDKLHKQHHIKADERKSMRAQLKKLLKLVRKDRKKVHKALRGKKGGTKIINVKPRSAHRKANKIMEKMEKKEMKKIMEKGPIVFKRGTARKKYKQMKRKRKAYLKRKKQK